MAFLTLDLRLRKLIFLSLLLILLSEYHSNTSSRDLSEESEIYAYNNAFKIINLFIWFVSLKSRLKGKVIKGYKILFHLFLFILILSENNICFCIQWICIWFSKTWHIFWLKIFKKDKQARERILSLLVCSRYILNSRHSTWSPESCQDWYLSLKLGVSTIYYKI